MDPKSFLSNFWGPLHDDAASSFDAVAHELIHDDRVEVEKKLYLCSDLCTDPR